MRDVMLLVAIYDVWMSLEELAKRHRKWEEAKKASVREMVWEYQVRRGMWVEEGVN